jgi:hypothetical protein
MVCLFIEIYWIVVEAIYKCYGKVLNVILKISQNGQYKFKVKKPGEVLRQT